MSDSNEAVYSHDSPGVKWSIRVPMTMPPAEAEFFLHVLQLVKRQVERRCLASAEAAEQRRDQEARNE